MSEAIDELIETLGARIVAVLGNVKDTAEVRKWQNQESSPAHPEVLEVALEAVKIIKPQTGNDAVRGWFAGTNSYLESKSPIDVLLENTPEARKRVLAAARAEVS